jgi:molybdopterin-guanine dinucleotide biosynthesis protein A
VKAHGRGGDFCTGVILAGGKNSRMGTNKAFLTIGGERLIDRTVRLFRSLFPETIIVTNAPRDYLDQDVAIATDIYPGKGALGGLYTGLFHAAGSHAFCVACDMPFLDARFIAHMRDRRDGRDIVVPLQPAGYQALHAIYGKACLVPMRQNILAGRLKITSFYRGRGILTLGEDVVHTFDSDARMFFNVNTPEDLHRLGLG